MAASAVRWAWEKSRASNGSLLVLLAIADEYDRKGAAEMTVMEIAAKARLSERAVQTGLRWLEAAREVSVTGSGRRRAYVPGPVDNSAKGAESAPLPVSKGADSAPPQNLHPAESAPQDEAKPQVRPKGAESAPHEISDGVVSTTGRSLVAVKPSPAKPPKQDDRPEVERLCEQLADRIEANGAKRPAITKKWRDACRRMIDIDGRTEQQIAAAIDWCQKDEFWHANILSMPKLREKYETLRMRAQQQLRQQPRNGSRPDFNQLRDIARELDRQEGRQ